MSILGVIVPTVGVMKPYPWEQAWSSIPKKNALSCKNQNCFGQMPCLNWIFVMMPSIVVSGTQTWNIKVRSSKVIIESIAQKVMGKPLDNHDLKYFEVGFFFVIFLEFISNFMTSMQKFVEKISLM